MDIEKIRAEAREILDKFGKELENVKISNLVKKSDEMGVRKERGGEKCDSDFRTIMLKNAPNKNDECIVLEKGAWV
jgi:Asp-tRNA(Asn)/Glu-tRNA(Gln) amidotransferase C subunit